MLNNIDFNKFHTFRSVAKAGSIRRAAEELCVTPSAISQALASLERQLGAQLFNRTGKRLSLNATGEQILERFSVLEDDFAHGLSEVLHERQSVEGIVRIGGYLEFTKTELQSKISIFLQEFPKIQLKFFFSSPSGLERLLDEDRIDMAISIFPYRRSTEFISSPIFTEELVLIAHKDRARAYQSVEEILNAPIIDYYQSHRVFQRWLSHHFTEEKIKGASSRLKIRAFAGTAEMVASFVQQQVGIGVVPRYIASSPSVRESIEIISPSPEELKDSIWLIEPSLNRNSYSQNSAIRRFRSHILTEIGGKSEQY